MKTIVIKHKHFDEISSYLVEEQEKSIVVRPVNTDLDSCWTKKGLLDKSRITCSGNNVSIHLSNRKKIILDYAELEYVRILIKLYEKRQKQQFKIMELKEYE